MHGSSGCLGCYNKPTLITSVGEQSKGPKVKCETVKKPSISEDFWTTSTCDMDYSAVQSQGSISSISIANQNQTLDQPGGSGKFTKISPSNENFYDDERLGGSCDMTPGG
ncbi:hypothetical protein NC651_002011 [Populus alba x Populus x berolinensis]|nr:hypothetical protein NC651_002011 [Populus alba x Populus x berolinensis]